MTLPKPPSEPEVKREHFEGTTERGRMLAQVGDKLTKEGHQYLGSFAVHIYKHKLAPQIITQVQTTNIASIGYQACDAAIKELVRVIMYKFGMKPPVKRGRDDRIDNSKLITDIKA